MIHPRHAVVLAAALLAAAALSIGINRSRASRWAALSREPAV
jgi:hypothetical protein